MPVETPPPAPVITPPAATPPAKPTVTDDPWVAQIVSDMGKVIKDGKIEDAPVKAPEAAPRDDSGQFTSMGEHARFKKEKEENKAVEDKAKTDKEAADAKEAEEKAKTATPPPPVAEPGKKKIEVEKAKPIEEIVEGVVSRVMKDQKPAAVTQPPPTPEPKKEEDPDKAFIEGLDEDQKEAVELAQFAAKAMPDKYGAMPKRMVDYLKKVDTYIAEERKKDANWDPDTDEGFATFIEENQPAYNPGDRKKLERNLIVDQAKTEVRQEMAPQIQETERAARVQQIKPEVDKAVESYTGVVAQRLAPDDKSPFHEVLKVAAEKGWTPDAWKEARKVDPLAAAAAQNFVGQANTLAREYLELVSDVSQQVAFKQELPLNHAHNQKALTQQRLFAFIDSQERIFAEQGGDMRVVNGRSFAPRSEMLKMNEAERAKHWTLGHDDVLDMLAVAASSQAKTALESEIKRREEEGYVRSAKNGTVKKEDAPLVVPPKREESPRATTTPAPGAATPPPPVAQPTVLSEDELKRMWSGGASAWAH